MRTSLEAITAWIEKRSPIEIAVALYVIAFGTRLLVAFLIGINHPFESDAKVYFDKAAMIAQGQGYVRLWQDGILRPSANHVPGTPLFLAAGILLFGKYEAVARLMAVTISSFSAPLTYRFGVRVGPVAPAALSGLCCAFYPSWVFYSPTALTEPFLIPLLLMSLLLTLVALDSPNSIAAFWAGLSWGAATLVRPVALPMTGIVSLYLAWRSGLKKGFLLSLGFLVFLSPWLVRNYLVFGRLLLATQGGQVFLGANNPDVVNIPRNHGMWISPGDVPEYRDRLRVVKDEISENKLENELARNYLRQNPGVIPRLAYYKLSRWLTPITETGGSIRIMTLVCYGGLILLVFSGFFRGVYKHSAAFTLVLIWTGVLVVMTIVYWGILLRGRLLLELVWIPWACLAFWDLIRRFAVKSVRQRPRLT